MIDGASIVYSASNLKVRLSSSIGLSAVIFYVTESPFPSISRFSLSSCSTDEKATSFFMSTTVLVTLCNFLYFLIGSGSQKRKETQRQINPIIIMRAEVASTTLYDYSLRNNRSDLYSDLETVNKQLRISSTLV